MLSICSVAGGPPGRLGALLELVRPVADEIVVAVDERVDLRRLGRVRELADVLVSYPFAEPVERPFAWLHSLCSGNWIFRIDDDEVPSARLLELLSTRDERLTHAWVPRRWLWGAGSWISADPWMPDWQLRLVRPSVARFPGQMHIPVQASGQHSYLEAPLYHLDLVVNDRARREEKVRRYEHERPGLRLGGLPLNAAYYLPELRGELPVAPVPEEDAVLIRAVQNAPAPRKRTPAHLRRATRGEIDAHWAEAPLRDEDLRATIELGRLPVPVVGEVREVDVRVTNLGGAVWPGGREGLPEIRLSYRWDGVEMPDDQLRTPFPHDVVPGETVLVPMSFRAPQEPGRHRLVVDLVHERHTWFGVDAAAELSVEPRRRGVVFVGQSPGEEAFDRRVDELLDRLEPSLEPVLVGAKPDWLRDRFGTDATREQPGHADSVFVLAAGRRTDRLRLHLRARRLARTAASGHAGRLSRSGMFLALGVLAAVVTFGTALDLAAAGGSNGSGNVAHRLTHPALHSEQVSTMHR